MTGNMSLLAPAMVAVAISSALVGDRTIYHSQLRTRADSPAHRVRFSFPLLSSLLVRDAMTQPGPVIRADATVSLAEAQLGTDGLAGIAVVDERGEVVGALTPAQVQRTSPSARTTTPVRAVLEEDAVPLEPDQPLDIALEKLAGDGMSWGAVVEGRRLVGQLHVRDVMETYKANLERSVRRAHALTAESTLFEVRVDASSPLAGRALRDAGFPRDTLVVSITRDGDTLFPRATTRLEPGDVALIMADQRSEPALRAFLGGSGRSKPHVEST